MKNIIEILKQLGYLVYKFAIEIIKNSWEPLLTLLIKIAIIAGILFAIGTLVPHGLSFIREISYIGWFTILCVYHLISAKIEDNFESEYDELLNKNDEEIPEIQTEIRSNIPLEVKELKDLISQPEQPKEKNDTESNRE